MSGPLAGAEAGDDPPQAVNISNIADKSIAKAEVLTELPNE